MDERQCDAMTSEAGKMAVELEALRARCRDLEAALQEIADEQRERHWCSKCRAWIQSKYASGNEWCPKCGTDVCDSGIADRYEEIARAASEKPA